jgi:hypothetical protein
MKLAEEFRQNADEWQQIEKDRCNRRASAAHR